MRGKIWVVGLVLAGVVGVIGGTGCETLSSGVGSVLGVLAAGGEGEGLTTQTIIAGLKEALQVGAEKTVAATSREGGYLENAAIRIPMPEKLEGMANSLRKIGLGAQVNRFETRMNQAAELAAREAAPVFIDAIKGMSFADAKGILQGDATAATEYFRRKTSARLRQRYQPIVTRQMEKLGAVSLYKDLQNRYNSIPLVPKLDASVEDYVADEALNGLFHVLGEEEKRIREDPAARTTELLRRVFGGQ